MVLRQQKNLAALAASGFEKKRMHKARLEAESREAVLAAAMRRIETETGVSSAEEFVARWERHATMNEQQQSIAVAKKHRQQDLQAEQVRSPSHLILRTCIRNLISNSICRVTSGGVRARRSGCPRNWRS